MSEDPTIIQNEVQTILKRLLKETLSNSSIQQIQHNFIESLKIDDISLQESEFLIYFKAFNDAVASYIPYLPITDIPLMVYIFLTDNCTAVTYSNMFTFRPDSIINDNADMTDQDIIDFFENYSNGDSTLPNVYNLKLVQEVIKKEHCHHNEDHYGNISFKNSVASSIYSFGTATVETCIHHQVTSFNGVPNGGKYGGPYNKPITIGGNGFTPGLGQIRLFNTPTITIVKSVDFISSSTTEIVIPGIFPYQANEIVSVVYYYGGIASSPAYYFETVL